MKTIILYAKMHREWCLYAGSLADGPKYDDAIDDFFGWLAEQAADAGFELIVSKRPSKRLYTVEKDDEAGHRFMRDERFAFWHWYYGTAPPTSHSESTTTN